LAPVKKQLPDWHLIRYRENCCENTRHFKLGCLSLAF
jgi:hypothetical protein